MFRPSSCMSESVSARTLLQYAADEKAEPQGQPDAFLRADPLRASKLILTSSLLVSVHDSTYKGLNAAKSPH